MQWLSLYHDVLIVGAGGFLGAVARYSLTLLVHRRVSSPFPLGTLLVNVVGCLCIGVLMALFYHAENTAGTDRHVLFDFLSHRTRLHLVTGLLGSLTTFSTFGFETLELLHRSEFGLALANVAMNLLVGLSAVWAGFSLVRGILD